MTSPVVLQAESAVENLSRVVDDDDLYAELGKRLTSMARTAAGSDRFDLVSDEPIETFGTADELKKLGRRFFVRWNKAAFDLVCGADVEDRQARADVAQAFKVGPEAIAATIAALLVTQLGMAAALAAVVATLTIRLFLKPTHQAMCDCWKDKLPQ